MWQLPPGIDRHSVTERENFCYHGTVQTSEMWCAVYMCLSSGPLLSVTQKPFMSVHSAYFTYNYISSVCCSPHFHRPHFIHWSAESPHILVQILPAEVHIFFRDRDRGISSHFKRNKMKYTSTVLGSDQRSEFNRRQN